MRDAAFKSLDRGLTEDCFVTATERAIQCEMIVDTAGPSEKIMQAQAGRQIAIWNDQGSWTGPLREYAKISTTVRNETHSNTAERRLLFFGWEVEKLITERRSRFMSARALLNSIFFEHLNFRVGESGASTPDPHNALLDSVLARRQGPTPLLVILYAWIGEKIAFAYGAESDFARIELVHSAPIDVVRVIPKIDLGEIHLASLADFGQPVQKNEWSLWCATSPSDGFTRLTWSQGLVRLLVALYKGLEKSNRTSVEELSKLLFVLDQIIVLQPSETGRWAERAVLNSRRGDRSSALLDLKRFFAFHERDSAPPGLITLYDDLRR